MEGKGSREHSKELEGQQRHGSSCEPVSDLLLVPGHTQDAPATVSMDAGNIGSMLGCSKWGLPGCLNCRSFCWDQRAGWALVFPHPPSLSCRNGVSKMNGV